jgi:hypothetical protein
MPALMKLWTSQHQRWQCILCLTSLRFPDSPERFLQPVLDFEVSISTGTVSYFLDLYKPVLYDTILLPLISPCIRGWHNANVAGYGNVCNNRLTKRRLPWLVLSSLSAQGLLIWQRPISRLISIGTACILDHSCRHEDGVSSCSQVATTEAFYCLVIDRDCLVKMGLARQSLVSISLFLACNGCFFSVISATTRPVQLHHRIALWLSIHPDVGVDSRYLKGFTFVKETA